MPKAKLRLRPSIKTYNSARLFDVSSRCLACLIIHDLSSEWIIKPMLALPSFPLEDPSKLNIDQPIGGGSHLHYAISCLFVLT